MTLIDVDFIVDTLRTSILSVTDRLVPDGVKVGRCHEMLKRTLIFQTCLKQGTSADLDVEPPE